MENYESAAVRHMADADLLLRSGNLDNAGHLVGFAAECAIKHQISSLRPNTDAPHGHFPEILMAARKHLGRRSSYTNMYDVLKGDIFRGWHVNRRYWVSGSTTEAEVNGWFATARRLLGAAGIKGRA